MTKVMYLTESVYIGDLVLSPGIFQVQNGVCDEYYRFYFKGRFFAAPKELFVEPLPVLMELF